MADKTQTTNYKRFWQSYETDKEDAFYQLNHTSKLNVIRVFVCVCVCVVFNSIGSKYEVLFVLHAI